MEICRNKDIKWKVVGGHVGVAGNMRCDEIATAFADGKKTPLYEGFLERYPLKHILDITYDRGLAREKRVNHTRSRAKAHSYVSLVDGRVETHTTWTECEERVNGKSGAKYKKAFTATDEQEIVNQFAKVRKHLKGNPAP